MTQGKENLEIVYGDGSSSVVNLIFPDSIDDITPLEITKAATLRVGYTFDGRYHDFASHHGRFVLQQAVMYVSHHSFYLSVMQSNQNVTEQESIKLIKLLHREASMLATAKKQWWWREVEYLIDEYKEEVYDYQWKVKADHDECPLFPSCDHKMWFALGKFVNGPVLLQLDNLAKK